MAEIRFPSGLTVRTFEPPPPDFDPLTASDSVLEHFGYQPRPDARLSPELYRQWERLASERGEYIVPEFKLNEGKQHGTRRNSRSAGPTTSTNWSGSIVFAPDANHTFFRASALWNIPRAYSPGKESCIWVGVDGDGSNDVLQIGVETMPPNPLMPYHDNCYAWWEWFPDPEVEITNMPVACGDNLSCYVYVKSPTVGQVYMYNRSKSKVTYFDVHAPANVSLVGNCAEWIVERPMVNGSIVSLAKYGRVYMDSCQANYKDTAIPPTDVAVVTSASGTFCTMIGDNNAPLSVAVSEGPHIMSVDWRKAS